MTEKLVVFTVLVVFFAERADSQFLDLFQIGHRQPSRSVPSFTDNFTTRRTKIENRKTTKKYEDIDEPYEISDYNRQNQYDRDKGNHISTQKPYRKAKHNQANSNTSNRKNEAVQAPKYDFNSNNFDNERNNNNHEYTNNNYNQDYNNNNNNYYTTQNPFYVRPGVKPVVIDNRPPITNRPITRRTTTVRYTTRPTTTRYTTKKTETDSIFFPKDTDDAPDVMLGRDEDGMSETEKRRFIDIAEGMCDKYKSLSNKQVQAIPLIPSPEPVKVNVSSCTPTNVPLVVGGKVVNIKEFPHMALLGWVKLEDGGYLWKCGGSLISDRWVLTAAHCAYQERDDRVATGPPRAVQLGSTYLDDPGALVVKVSTVIRHPKYKAPTSYYDIALLKLVKSVTFSEVIKPACLGVPPRVGRPIIATGWGKTEFGDQSLELRSVSVPVWDINECRRVLGTSRKLPNGPSDDSQLCAGEAKGGKDTCQGDSGGPAQIQEGCTWRIVAITSLGRSCGAPQTPGVYAKLQRAFIASHVFADYTYTHQISTNNRPEYTSGQNNNNGWAENDNKQENHNSNSNQGSNWQNSASNKWNRNNNGPNSGSYDREGSTSNKRNDNSGNGNNFQSGKGNDYSSNNGDYGYSGGSQSIQAVGNQRPNYENNRNNRDQYNSNGSNDYYGSSFNRNNNNRGGYERSNRESNRRNPYNDETETDGYRSSNRKQNNGQNVNIYDRGNVWWT